MKIESCPKCDGKMFRAGTEMTWRSIRIFKKIFITISGWDEEFWCEKCGHYGIWMRSFSIKSCIRKFNRWARRERRRMKKEADA